MSKATKKQTIRQYRADHPDRKWVSKIVEHSERTGRATRLEICCQLPGCDERREIAVQDAFQVKYCCAEHRREARKAG